MYKLNVNKEDIRKFDKEALICELGFYIGTKKEIDEYIKKNILGIEHNADEYFVFYMFCKFVVEKFFDSEVQDIYELIDYNYIRLVGMFLNEKCEVVDNILNKVDKLVENKKSNDEIIKNQCLEDIKNCYGKVEKYFKRYDECMKAIKTCFDNKIVNFHKDYNSRLCNFEKYTEMVGSTMKVVKLGYFAVIGTSQKMEQINLFGMYESDKFVDYSSIHKEFKICYENGNLCIGQNVNKDIGKIDLKNVDLNNSIIQEYYQDIAFVCRGFEKIIDYVNEVEKIISEL